jgi:hypothetical protein
MPPKGYRPTVEQRERERDRARRDRARGASWVVALNARRRAAYHTPAAKSRRMAITRTRRLVASGQLPPVTELVCADCAEPAREYHHDDYDKPDVVRALCKGCHRRWHYDNAPKGALEGR